MDKTKVDKKEVSNFWNEHPLGSYEKSFEDNVDDFYTFLDSKRSIASKFSRKLQEYEKNRGKTVLELGCGPGWNVKNLAEHGANISACDITITGARLAKNWLQNLELKGNICVGDVESSPFRSNYFDFVLCDGVLHHTPGIENGLAEIYRTLKTGGKSVISVYYENILLRGFMFPVTKFVLWLLHVKFLGSKRVYLSMTKEEFGRLYDGTDNVLGKIYTRNEITTLIKESGLIISGTQLHFFPTPFLPGGRYIPDWIEYILGRLFGTMIFFQVTK